MQPSAVLLLLLLLLLLPRKKAHALARNWATTLVLSLPFYRPYGEVTWLAHTSGLSGSARLFTRDSRARNAACDASPGVQGAKSIEMMLWGRYRGYTEAWWPGLFVGSSGSCRGLRDIRIRRLCCSVR